MSKHAFVVMPYDSRFNRLYSLVIETTLKNKGYSSFGADYRQDRSGEGGVIMNNVIDKVGKSDIVIVVLDDLDWNVAYELGISHVMNRSGTVLMCTKETEQKMPFDIKHLNILYYDSDWLKNETEGNIIEELSRRIDNAENLGGCDSPVHSVFNKFPSKLSSLMDDDNGQRIEKLEKENKALYERLKKAGLDEDNTEQEEDVVRTIQKAIADRIYYSDTAVDKLMEYQKNGNVEEFGKFLGDVMLKGYLDEIDCRKVCVLCDRLKASSLTKVFLEYATKLYPDNEELNTRYANELARMPQTRNQALVLADKMIGLVRKNGKFELVSKHVSNETLAAFMDVYIKLRKFEDIIKIVPILIQEYQKVKTQCLLYRNMMTAYMTLEKFEEAERIGCTLFEMDPKNDLNHYSMYRLFRQTDRYVAAYEALENCIQLDPKDVDYYFLIAGLIFDENVARERPNEQVHRIADSDVKKYALPFVLTSLIVVNSPEVIERLQHFLSRNDCLAELEKLRNGKLDELMADYDDSMVKYCLQKEITSFFHEDKN